MSGIGNTAELSIATWNVFNRSSTPSQINYLNSDILAYQELTKAHLQALNDQIKTAEDFVEGAELTYLGLRSDLPLERCQRIALNPDRRLSPSFLGRRMRWIEGLQALHLVYRWSGEALSVVNLHLSCAVSMEQRRDALDRLLASVDLAPRTVILGDFNSFESWWLWPLLAPLTGARPKPIGFTEVDDLADAMRSRGFERIRTRRATYPKMNLTLDHIFYRGLTATSHQVASERRGSDHRSITACFVA